MSKRLLVIPVLLFCMLFNGNLSTLVVVVLKSCSLCSIDEQSLLSLESETDGDGDADDHNGESAPHCSLACTKVRLTHPVPAATTDPHDLIYALHNLRI